MGWTFRSIIEPAPLLGTHSASASQGCRTPPGCAAYSADVMPAGPSADSDSVRVKLRGSENGEGQAAFAGSASTFPPARVCEQGQTGVLGWRGDNLVPNIVVRCRVVDPRIGPPCGCTNVIGDRTTPRAGSQVVLSLHPVSSRTALLRADTPNSTVLLSKLYYRISRISIPVGIGH